MTARATSTTADPTPPHPAAKLDRRERVRVATRERITEAAMRLFVEEGFENTSMRRIADAVGYTPGALYAYFEDKDEILYALLEAGFARLREAMHHTPTLAPRYLSIPPSATFTTLPSASVFSLAGLEGRPRTSKISGAFL